jgi:uncharacterized protein YndB with AHSA1/START domain
MENHYKITCATTFNATLEEVWNVLTNPDMVKKYLFGTTLVTNWQIGEPIVFKGEWEGQAYEDKGKILAYDVHKHIAYAYLSSWSGKEDLAENYLIVTYTLNQLNKETQLVITQTNYDEEKAIHSEKNWTFLMEEMRKILHN